MGRRLSLVVIPLLGLIAVAAAAAVGSRGTAGFRLAVAVESPARGIYRVDPAGKPARLTTTWNDAFPAWSHDGASIAFVRVLKPGARYSDCALMVVKASGGAARRIPGVTSACRAVSWGPTNLIAFNDAKGGVWAVRPDGKGLKKVVAPGKDPGLTLNPAWAPDGRTLAFGNGVLGGIVVVGADGRGLRQLTKPVAGAADGFPAWSPNGNIVFVRTGSADFSTTIMVARRDGSAVRPVLKLTGEVDYIRPAWTPDSSSIVYSDPYGISIVSASGGSSRTLVPGHYTNRLLPRRVERPAPPLSGRR